MIRVDRDAMWNVLRSYGIGGRLLRGVRSLYSMWAVKFVLG